MSKIMQQYARRRDGNAMEEQTTTQIEITEDARALISHRAERLPRHRRDRGLQTRTLRAAIALAAGLAMVATACTPPPSPEADSTKPSAFEEEVVDVLESHGLVTGVEPHDSVDLPTDPDLPMRMVAESTEIEIGLPLRGTLSEGVQLPHGSVAHEDAEEDAVIVTQPQSDGQARILAILRSELSPERYAYDFAANGSHVQLTLDAFGGVSVVDSVGNKVLFVLPPWATDAEGRDVPTRYEVNGTSLVQVVDHLGAGFTYPIVADPATCGWVTCTWYFGKRATKDLSSASSATAVCGALAKIPPLAVGCAVAWAAIVVQANRAVNRNMCLKIKYAKVGFPIWVPDIYRGGHCR
jgi:hypothetical protein